MKQVRIISGTYGYRPNPARGSIVAVTAKDGPIWVTAEEAERLIKRGVAKLVKDEQESPVRAVATGQDGTDDPNASVPPPNTEDDARGNDGTNDGPGPAIELMGKRAAELKELMKAAGLSFKFGMTKADMAEALLEQAAPDDSEDDGDDDGEDPPNFGAADPVL